MLSKYITFLNSKINQEIYTRSITIVNEFKQNLQSICTFFQNFFEEDRLKFRQKNCTLAFPYIIYKKIKFSNGKTGNLLRLKQNISTISYL